MLYSRRMRLPSIAVAALLWLSCLLSISPAQTPAPGAPEDYSGMYSFVKDGEFMQITEEDKGAVSGFISRYGDSENDKGAFIDQFVKSGSWTSKQLSFTTEKVHGIVYGFDGAFDRGAGKRLSEEGFYILRGTLTRSATSADGKSTSTQSRQVEFRSFPRDVDPPK